MLVLKNLRKYTVGSSHNKKDKLFVWKINKRNALYSRYRTYDKRLNRCITTTFTKTKFRIFLLEEYYHINLYNIILRKNRMVTYECAIDPEESVYYLNIIDCRKGKYV